MRRKGGSAQELEEARIASNDPLSLWHHIFKSATREAKGHGRRTIRLGVGILRQRGAQPHGPGARRAHREVVGVD